MDDAQLAIRLVRLEREIFAVQALLVEILQRIRREKIGDAPDAEHQDDGA